MGTSRISARFKSGWTVARSPASDQRDLVEAAHRRPDGTCPNATDRGRPPTSACASGPWTGRGRRSSTPRSSKTTRSARSSGSSPPTPPWSGLTSIRPVPGKRGLHTSGRGPRGRQRCLGRSRRGLSSTIHLAVRGRGMPMSVVLTAGQAGDNPQLMPLLKQIEVARPGGGRPRSRPEAVVTGPDVFASEYPRPLRGRGIFGSPVRSGRIRRRRERRRGHVVVAHHRSAGSNTPVATSSGAASTGSNTPVTWPPATPNGRPTSDRS